MTIVFSREIWFFTKIISVVALSLFVISVIVWGSWLQKKHPAYEAASGAIINSIGCLTAFVPQVRLTVVQPAERSKSPSGIAHLCRFVSDNYRKPYGETQCPGKISGQY